MRTTLRHQSQSAHVLVRNTDFEKNNKARYYRPLRCESAAEVEYSVVSRSLICRHVQNRSVLEDSFRMASSLQNYLHALYQKIWRAIESQFGDRYRPFRDHGGTALLVREGLYRSRPGSIFRDLDEMIESMVSLTRYLISRYPM